MEMEPIQYIVAWKFHLSCLLLNTQSDLFVMGMQGLNS